MTPGTYISGTGHAALIVWFIAGWGLQSDPLEFQFTEVSVVSGAEFEAMQRRGQPDAPAEEVIAPTVPEIEAPSVPEPPAEDTPPDVAEPPTPVAEPQAETPPEAPELETPPAEVADVAPDLPDLSDVETPPPSVELGESLRPQPRPADRIAPEAIAPPEPDAAVAPDVAVASSDVPTEEVTDEPVEETTAPEEATTEVVTEAETPSAAPEISLRPQTRPNRPAPPASEEDSVLAALEEAGAGEDQPNDTPSQPTAGVQGGELTDAQKSSILRQIGNCWNVGSASTGALQTRVSVSFAMDPGGVLDTGSIQLLGYEGGSAEDANVAFRIAKSALVRCQFDGGRNGYELPSEQFQERRVLRMTFDPSEMRTR